MDGGYQLFYDWLVYVMDILQDLFSLITSSWLLSVIFGLVVVTLAVEVILYGNDNRKGNE